MAKKSYPTEEPRPGNEWVPCPTCQREGEIISYWSAGADTKVIRCPRCFSLGWVQRSIGGLTEQHPPACTCAACSKARSRSLDDKPSISHRLHPPSCQCDACFKARISTWMGDNRSGVEQGAGEPHRPPEIMPSNRVEDGNHPYNCRCSVCLAKTQPSRSSSVPPRAPRNRRKKLKRKRRGNVPHRPPENRRPFPYPGPRGPVRGLILGIRKLGSIFLKLFVPILLLGSVGYIIFQYAFDYWEDDTNQEAQASRKLEELRQYALDLINKDRAVHDLPPVVLGDNPAAQLHAEDMLEHDYQGHWWIDGRKPYMVYTETGGKSYAGENVASGGWTEQEWQRENCNSLFVVCETSSPRELVNLQQWAMMYDDAHADWGHRDNILDEGHRAVNIGIAF